MPGKQSRPWLLPDLFFRDSLACLRPDFGCASLKLPFLPLCIAHVPHASPPGLTNGKENEAGQREGDLKAATQK